MYVLVQPFLGIYGMQSIHDICNAFRIVCLDTIKEVALKCRKYSFCRSLDLSMNSFLFQDVLHNSQSNILWGHSHTERPWCPFFYFGTSTYLDISSTSCFQLLCIISYLLQLLLYNITLFSLHTFLGFKMRSSPIGISLNIKNVFWCTFFSLVVGRRRKPDRILMGYFSRKCRKIARYFTMSIVPVLPPAVISDCHINN